jgi:hypothetical protein
MKPVMWRDHRDGSTYYRPPATIPSRAAGASGCLWCRACGRRPSVNARTAAELSQPLLESRLVREAATAGRTTNQSARIETGTAGHHAAHSTAVLTPNTDQRRSGRRCIRAEQQARYCHSGRGR